MVVAGLAMGAMECLGLVMVVFGPALGIFAATIARDPLRVIIFVLGCFFYLVGLLLAALIWFAVVPLRKDGAFEFGLFVSVLFQEGARCLFYVTLAKARAGLERVSSGSLNIAGVHSLGNQRLLAVVSGLGFGVMAAAFASVNLLADISGPGTLGFPHKLAPHNDKLKGGYTFPLTSAFYAQAMCLLHVAWTVLMWDSQARWRTGPGLWWSGMLAAICGHLFVSGISLINTMGLISVSLPLAYLVLILSSIYAGSLAGASLNSFKAFLMCSSPESSVDAATQPIGEDTNVAAPAPVANSNLRRRN